MTSSSSLGSRCVLWLGEGLSMSSPNDPVLCCPLPYRVAPVFVQVVSPPLGWSPLSSFLVIWSPSGDARDPSVVFEAVNMPCPGPFHFSQCRLYLLVWGLSSPWPRCWSCYLCMWCWAYFFPFWSVRPQVCSVHVWSVSTCYGWHSRWFLEEQSASINFIVAVHLIISLVHSQIMCDFPER